MSFSPNKLIITEGLVIEVSPGGKFKMVLSVVQTVKYNFLQWFDVRYYEGEEPLHVY